MKFYTVELRQLTGAQFYQRNTFHSRHQPRQKIRNIYLKNTLQQATSACKTGLTDNVFQPHLLLPGCQNVNSLSAAQKDGDWHSVYSGRWRDDNDNVEPSIKVHKQDPIALLLGRSRSCSIKNTIPLSTEPFTPSANISMSVMQWYDCGSIK